MQAGVLIALPSATPLAPSGVTGSLIATAKLNGVDPQAWLTDVLCRIADHAASRLDELLPWHWKRPEISAAAA
jgi:hypothetical protein